MSNTKRVVTEDYTTFEFQGATFRLRKKFKRIRFLRMLSNDPVAALELAIPEDDFERIEDLDMDESDMEKLFEAISVAITGGPKN